MTLCAAVRRSERSSARRTIVGVLAAPRSWSSVQTYDGDLPAVYRIRTWMGGRVLRGEIEGLTPDAQAYLADRRCRVAVAEMADS